MSNPVIKVENLGKRYTIAHEQRERYTALRDVIANKAKHLGCTLRTAITKHQSPIIGGFEDFWALRDVFFEIKQGDRVGIIGRNGAGKSTLLKLLARITEPTTGRITLRGRVASLLEVGTGFHPELTGRENIFLNGAILGMSKQEIKSKFDEIVDFAEIEKFLDTPVKRYSSGMYVRLAFAVAAHLEPEILLVDEVLAVGDAQFQKKCLGKMEDVSAREGRTVLFVSHNMAAINNLCSLSMEIDNGKVGLFGSTREVVQHYLSAVDMPGNEVSDTSGSLVKDIDLDVLNFHACDRMRRRKKIFKTSDIINFFIEYDLKRQLPGLRVGIDLIDLADGDVIFRSFDDDSGFRTRNLGQTSVVCSVPADLLKPGTYLVKLQIGIHNVRWIVYDLLIEKIFVELIDGVNGIYGDYRPGRIMPKIDWT